MQKSFSIFAFTAINQNYNLLSKHNRVNQGKSNESKKRKTGNAVWNCWNVDVPRNDNKPVAYPYAVITRKRLIAAKRLALSINM